MSPNSSACRAERRSGDRRSHRTIGLEGPFQAAVLRAHRLDGSAGAADEHMAIEHRRLRVGGDVALEGECPFELATA